MKIFYKESGDIRYASYQFPYCVYAIREKGDAYRLFYEQGFLPYSNDLNREEEIFYLARSVRVDLDEHQNRFKQNNVLNKLGNIYPPEDLSFEVMEKQDLMEDETFLQWSLDHAKDHFLKRERLDYILTRPYLRRILKISHQGKLLACLYLISEDREFVHVWFSFYDTQIALNDFGKFILLNALDWSKRQGYRYFYIGTCYPPGGFYKLTLSTKTEYFDGEGWCRDVSRLRSAMAGAGK